MTTVKMALRQGMLDKDQLRLSALILLHLFLLLRSPLLLSIFTNSRLSQKQAADVFGFEMNLSLLFSLVFFWITLVIIAAPNTGICYDANAIQTTDYFVCNPEAEVSACCEAGDACLSNGLCQRSVNGSYTPFFTSACTDYTWNSSSTCPAICNNNKTRQVTSYGAVSLTLQRQC